MAVAIAFAKGCLPCVVPYRATVLRSHRRFWSRLNRCPGNGPFRTSCGNGPPWFCSCLTNRWCPTARRHSGCSSIRVQYAVGDTVGARGTFPWTTSQDGAARRIFPPLDHALVKAVACALVAATRQPLRRQSLADVTARTRHALGTPISRSTVWRMLETDAIKPWRYKSGIFPRDLRFAVETHPVQDRRVGRQTQSFEGLRSRYSDSRKFPGRNSGHRRLPGAAGRT